jgi:hypothetical protein
MDDNFFQFVLVAEALAETAQAPSFGPNIQ